MKTRCDGSGTVLGVDLNPGGHLGDSRIRSSAGRVRRTECPECGRRQRDVLDTSGRYPTRRIPEHDEMPIGRLLVWIGVIGTLMLAIVAVAAF